MRNRERDMGKGRKPCCVKSEVKRGVWSLDEDQKLIDFVQRNGHINWRTLPQRAGLQRCGKSCRLRWINYLNPNVKLGNFTKEEEDTIIKLQENMGNKWATIATYLPGRTDNEIKNLWNTHLKKRLYKDDTNSTTNGPNRPPFSAASSSSSTTMIECSHGGRKGKYIEMGNVMNGMDQKAKKPRQEEAQNPQFFNQFVFSNMGMREMPTFPSNNSILSHQEVLDFPDPGFDEAMFMSNLLGEVNQPLNTATIAQENVLEKPILDPNKDIWKIIEEMEPSELQHQIDEAATQSAEEKWMTYLENQLDLDDDDDDNVKQTTTKEAMDGNDGGVEEAEAQPHREAERCRSLNPCD